MHYYAFSLFNHIQATVFKVITDEGSISADNPGNGNTNAKSINQAHFHMAASTLDRSLKNLFKILGEAEVLDETDMFKNSIFSDDYKAMIAAQAKKRIPQNLHVDTAFLKKQTVAQLKQQQQVTQPTHKKNVGALDSLMGDMINIPKVWSEGEIALCPVKLCNKSKGCHTPDCNKTHDDPVKWSPALKTCMIAHVSTDANLSWNHQVVTPEMLSMKFSKAPEVP